MQRATRSKGPVSTQSLTAIKKRTVVAPRKITAKKLAELVKQPGQLPTLEEMKMIKIAIEKNTPKFRKNMKYVDKSEINNCIPYKIEQSGTDTYVFLDHGLVAAGSFGILYKAVSVNTGKMVGIKIIKGLIGEETTEKQLSVELAAFETTKVCAKDVSCLLDHYELDGHKRIVMSFVNGPDLKTYMKQLPLQTSGGIVGRQERNDLAKKLFQTFETLHKLQQVAHQDVKDDGNTMWDYEQDAPVVIDFGELCSKEKHCRTDRRGAEKCERPCGFIGTLYTTPNDRIFKQIVKIAELIVKHKAQVEQYLTPAQKKLYETVFPYSELTVEFMDALGHDVWALGVMLLRWYTFEQSDFIDEDNEDPVYAWSEERIHDRIASIPNKNVQFILESLLNRDLITRLNNWENCARLIKTLPSVKFNTPEYEKLKDEFLNKPDANKDAAVALRNALASSVDQMVIAYMLSARARPVKLAKKMKSSAKRSKKVKRSKKGSAKKVKRSKKIVKKISKRKSVGKKK